MKRRGDGLDRTMRGHPRRHDPDLGELQRVARGNRRLEVPAMNWIERSAQNADPYVHACSEVRGARSEVRGLRSLRAFTCFHMASRSAGNPSPVAAETA